MATLSGIPPPLQHPVIGANGMVTVPWASYFRSLASTVDNNGYMLQATYDPTSSGSVLDSDGLGGQPASYYLDLANHTGLLAVASTQWNLRTFTGSDTAAVGDLCDVDASIAAVTVSLPPADDATGRAIVVAKADSSGNSVTVDGGGFNINGASTQVISVQYTTLVLVSVGYEWRLM